MSVGMSFAEMMTHSFRIQHVLIPKLILNLVRLTVICAYFGRCSILQYYHIIDSSAHLDRTLETNEFAQYFLKLLTLVVHHLNTFVANTSQIEINSIENK